MKSFRLITICGTALSLAACASTPMGPTVQVLPQRGKPFEIFQQEQAYCKQYAESQVHDQAEAANNTAILEGVGGTILGAGLGAAVGGGRGAAIGAAGGAIAGTAVGSGTSGQKQGGIQVQYNNAYEQCMVSKGNVLQRPVAQTHTTVVVTQPAPTVVYTQAPPPTVVYTSPPATVYAPPPPPGAPPY